MPGSSPVLVLRLNTSVLVCLLSSSWLSKAFGVSHIWRGANLWIEELGESLQMQGIHSSIVSQTSLSAKPMRCRWRCSKQSELCHSYRSWQLPWYPLSESLPSFPSALHFKLLLHILGYRVLNGISCFSQDNLALSCFFRQDD